MDDDEEKLEDTVANALAQIEEKQYEAVLIVDSYAADNIRKYGFAFQGKNAWLEDDMPCTFCTCIHIFMSNNE